MAPADSAEPVGVFLSLRLRSDESDPEIPSEGGRLLPVRRAELGWIAAVDPDGIQRQQDGVPRGSQEPADGTGLYG